MKHSIWNLSLMAAALALMVACGKNKSDEGVKVNGAPGTVAAGPSGLPVGQANVDRSAGGRITGTDPNVFNESVKALVSTTVQPAEVGPVDLQSGISFHASVQVNPTNGAVMPNSMIQLTIMDSYALQGSEPIAIYLQQGSGTASNGNAQLTFSDQYGSITVSGTYTASMFKGTVSFANTQGTGFNGKNAGVLGELTMPTCALFVCN